MTGQRKRSQLHKPERLPVMASTGMAGIRGKDPRCCAAGQGLSAATIAPHDTLDNGSRSAQGSSPSGSPPPGRTDPGLQPDTGRARLLPPYTYGLSARPTIGTIPAVIGLHAIGLAVDSRRYTDQRYRASGAPRFHNHELLPGAGRLCRRCSYGVARGKQSAAVLRRAAEPPVLALGRAGHPCHRVLFAHKQSRRSSHVRSPVLTCALLCAVLCGLVLAAPNVQAKSAPTKSRTSDLLTFIRHLEAGAEGYDAYERRISVAPPKRLTAMRVGEVLAWQRRVRNAGNPSTAAGGYQIIRKTLDRLVRKGAVSRTALFNAETQDHLARTLIGECGSRAAPTRFANCLARIWAALPLVSGPNRGRSAHHGVAGNRALTRPQTVLALLSGKPVTVAPGSAPDSGTKAVMPAGGPAVSRSDLRYRTIARPSRASISKAMRQASKDGTLTPSVRKWEIDPYAQE